MVFQSVFLNFKQKQAAFRAFAQRQLRQPICIGNCFLWVVAQRLYITQNSGKGRPFELLV